MRNTKRFLRTWKKPVLMMFCTDGIRYIVVSRNQPNWLADNQSRDLNNEFLLVFHLYRYLPKLKLVDSTAAYYFEKTHYSVGPTRPPLSHTHTQTHTSQFTLSLSQLTPNIIITTTPLFSTVSPSPCTHPHASFVLICSGKGPSKELFKSLFPHGVDIPITGGGCLSPVRKRKKKEF